LPSFETEGPAYPETVLGGIEDEAWNPVRLPPTFNNQTGAPFQDCSFRSATLACGDGRHEHSRIPLSLDGDCELSATLGPLGSLITSRIPTHVLSQSLDLAALLESEEHGSQPKATQRSPSRMDSSAYGLGVRTESTNVKPLTDQKNTASAAQR
jgi:hypothetical protein